MKFALHILLQAIHSLWLLLRNHCFPSCRETEHAFLNSQNLNERMVFLSRMQVHFIIRMTLFNAKELKNTQTHNVMQWTDLQSRTVSNTPHGSRRED